MSRAVTILGLPSYTVVTRYYSIVKDLIRVELGSDRLRMPSEHAEYVTHRGVKVLGAEATAYLSMNELCQLDEETATHSRGYIQRWLAGERRLMVKSVTCSERPKAICGLVD
jgi:hypothetical protein